MDILSSSFLYKIYIKNLSDSYLSSLDIIKYNDIGGEYIKGTYISDFNFDNKDGLLINNRNRRIFFSNENIIKCIPIETIETI